MRALIVEHNANLGGLWQRHMMRLGVETSLVTSQAQALSLLRDQFFDVIVLNLVLENGTLALSDYVSFRHPDTEVVFVSDSTFFSDGSIFNFCSNARALVPTATPPADLAAMVEHYGTLRRAA